IREQALRRAGVLTKPLGALGRLETLAAQLCAIQGTLDMRVENPVGLVFAADHGVAQLGVSAYPREVTAQMVLNFLGGGAAISVLAREVGARVVVADMGVDAVLPAHEGLRAVKVRRGTKSITRGPAMSEAEAAQAIDAGRQMVREEDPDVALTGDMGIGNTTVSAALICALTGLEPAVVVGRGTGVDDDGLRRKQGAVALALEVNEDAIRRGPMAAL